LSAGLSSQQQTYQLQKCPAYIRCAPIFVVHLTAARHAMQEVIDLRHQVSGRLRGVAARIAHAELARAWDAWQERVLLRQMAIMAVAKWKAGMVAR
jgi:hypothetical protein